MVRLPLWIPVFLILIRIGWVWIPIPLVLLWPLMLIAFVFLSLAMLIGSRTRWAPRRPLLAVWRLWCIFGALRGLNVHVRAASGPRPARGEAAPVAREKRPPTVWVWAI